MAFLVVSIGVMILRRTHPELPASGLRYPLFPGGPACFSIAGCIWIIQDLRPVTIYVFLIWVSVALVWYFTYGHTGTRTSGGMSTSAWTRTPADDHRRRLRP